MIIDPKRDPIPKEYYFFVKTDGVVENGFSLVGYTPAEWWQREIRLILSLDHSGIFSTLLYRHQITGESFAVSLGMHNYHVWSYIVTATDNETPDSVHTSFNHGERGDYRWRSLDWFTQELSMGRAAVKIRKGGKYCPELSENSGGYSVTISFRAYSDIGICAMKHYISY